MKVLVQKLSDEFCYCSDIISCGIPCAKGTCPNRPKSYSHVNNGLGRVETRLLEMWIHWDSIQKSVEGKLLSEKDTMTYQDVYFQKDKCKKILKEKLRIEKAFRAVTHEDIHKFIVR